MIAPIMISEDGSVVLNHLDERMINQMKGAGLSCGPKASFISVMGHLIYEKG